MRDPTSLSRAALALAVAQLALGLLLVVSPNSEGWLGGGLYAALYAAPLLVMALCLRSRRRRLRLAAGWLALVLALFSSGIVLVNLHGYTTSQLIFVLAITPPAVALELIVFFAVIARDRTPRRDAT